MNNRTRQLFVLLCLFCGHMAFAQSAKEIFSNSGIWEDYGYPVSADLYPEFKGRLVNINWADIEVSPNVWNWTEFDSDIEQHIADGMPVIFMVYTGMNAPTWLFANGVPKVNQNSGGVPNGYSPYYLDPEYNFYFKRMITTVRQHVEALDPSVRNKIIGVQACFGSTGDQIGYKGDVAKQYQVTDDQLDSLFKVFSLCYYNEYKDLEPKIAILNNPDYEHSGQQLWLNTNCPGGWTKCGTMAKGSQLNMESDKNSWLYNLLNQPSTGTYVKSRSEIVGQQLYAGWWTKNQYKEMFATMCYCIYWGIDWPNETSSIIKDPKFDSTFNFFNKYAGQKIPGLAQNALCALKDALDASDSIRFPSSAYGAPVHSNQLRYVNIYKDFISYGAKLQDLASATGIEYDCLGAKGTNDVGWHLLPGNYERFLHQIDANKTSAGYWNIDSTHPDDMYGRFARGFDLSKGKNALYFDVQDDFLRNKPLKAEYTVTIDITYYDHGTGSWQFFYDAQSKPNKASSNIVCTNTNTWKKATFVLTDACFANKGERNSDFYIKNTGSSNVVFSIVELARPQQSTASFVASSIASFDTLCQNSIIASKSFVLNAASLNGTKVQIGPRNHFSFSNYPDSAFTSTLTFTNYGSAINSVIYVKLDTKDTGNFSGSIKIQGGGLPSIQVKVKGYIQNSSPVLKANITPISCYNSKNASIELNPQGGTGPFTYNWTNDIQEHWSSTDKDISNLNVANYTVVVNSFGGCKISKTFNITQPDKLFTNVAQDSAIKCKGGSTTVRVSALGGTTPYSGTGVFTVSSGFKTYTVSDAHGCSDPQGYTVAAGTIPIPYKPAGINGPSIATSSQKSLVFSIQNSNSLNNYYWTVPSDAKVVAGQNTPTVTINWGTMTGSINVQTVNDCGESPLLSKKITVSNSNAFGTNMSGSVVLMPNPVKDAAMLVFTSSTNAPFILEVTDISGRLLLVKKGRALIGINNEPINVQHLSAGLYFVTLTINASEKQILELVKQ